MDPQNTDNVPTTAVESSASSSSNLATESPTMTQATSNNVGINDILNSEYTTVLPTNAPVKRFIRKITHIDAKKLQQAGLNRKIAEAIREQKLQMGIKKPPQSTVTSCNKLAPSASSSVIKSTSTTTIQTTTKPCSSSTVIQSSAPPSPTACKPLPTKTIIPPKITITAPEAQNETDRHHMEGLSPQERLKQVKHMLNQKLLLKKISNQPGMSIHLQPTDTVTPAAPKPKKLPTLVNTPPQPPKGFIHLIEPPEENTPNKPVIKNKTLQKSPQDIARKLDFPTDVEKPNLIQYIRKNPMKFLNKTESIGDIPKASIKPANLNLNQKQKQLIQSRQKIDYPEVSPLKTPFPTANIPLETPLPTIDTFKKPYPMSDSNYYHLQNETQSNSCPTTIEFINENYEYPPPTQHTPYNEDKDLNVASSTSPNCLIVLENKILSQDEMIDLTALRLSTSNAPQRFARPHKPIPEVVIKQEKPDDFPTTTSASTSIPQNTTTAMSLQKDLPVHGIVADTEMVHLPAKRNRKIIVNAQKLKLPQEKIAELAKKIAQSTTGTKTKPNTNQQTNKVNILENLNQGKSDKQPEMRLLNTKPMYKTNSLTNDKKPEVLNFHSQTVTTETKPKLSNRVLNETQTSITATNRFQQATQGQKHMVMVKQEPKALQISPPKELTVNLADIMENNGMVIKPLPPQGLQKVFMKTQPKITSSPLKFNTSFTGNRKSAVEIVDETSDTEDGFSAVDFLASFVDTNPITEETTLELSPEELNLSASCAMNLSPLRIPTYLPCKKRIATPQRQLTIPITTSSTSTSSQYTTNDSSTEIGKIVALDEVKTVDISSKNISQTLNTILIQSSNGPETILTKTAECKCPHITIPASKLKPVKILNTLDSTKISPSKLRDYGLNEFTTNTPPGSSNKLKSNKLENVMTKKSDILEKSKELDDSIVDKAETNLLNNTPYQEIVNEHSQENLEYVKPTESITKTDDFIQENVSNDTPEKSVKSALLPDMDEANCSPSLDKTQTNLSNNSEEKSREMTVKASAEPLEESVKTPVTTTNKSDDNTAEKSTEITVKTAGKSTGKSVEISLNPVSTIEIEKNVVLEPDDKNDSSNPTEPVDLNNTTKDEAINNLSTKTSDIADGCLEYSNYNIKNPKDTPQNEGTNSTTNDVAENVKSTKSPVKSPEKSINLKSILKLTVASNEVQQTHTETSDSKDCPGQDRNVIKSRETSETEDNETTKLNELKSIQATEQTTTTTTTNESNSNNNGPSKRISRFKKGKINLVVRNKPGGVTKKATTTSEEIKEIKEGDKVEQDDAAQSERSTTRKGECTTQEVIIENEVTVSKGDKVERDDTKSESSNIKNIECITGNIEVGNENKVNTEDKYETEDSLIGNTTELISDSENANKIMEEPTISEEINISENAISIEDQIKETSKDKNTQVLNKDIDKSIPTKPIDIQSQEDKRIHLENETVTSNVNENDAYSHLNTTEPGKEEKKTETKNATTESRNDDLNTDKAASSYAASDEVVVVVAAEKPSASVELSYNDIQLKELLQTNKSLKTISTNVSHLIKPPTMPKRKSEVNDLEDLLPHSEQVLEEIQQLIIPLVKIVKHSSEEMPPNLPKIPFKRKCSETITKCEQEQPKGINTLLKIKKFADIDSKNLENQKKKSKENETNLLKSTENKESTSNITSTQLKKSKTNENKLEADACSEEPNTSGKETIRRSGRATLQKAETSIVKANENSKNAESPLLSRRSLRFSLNSKTETATPPPPTPPTPPHPPKTRHSSRHQISDDDLEFLPVNAEIKEFRVTKTRKSLSDTSNTKEKTIDCSAEKTKRKRLSSKTMEMEDSIENVSEGTKSTRLTSKFMQVDVTRQVEQNVAVQTPTVTLTKRNRFDTKKSESEDSHRDDSTMTPSENKQLTAHLTKRTRFSSQSSETEAKSLNDSSPTKLLTHSVLITRSCLATKPTDPEDSCQDSPHDIKRSHTRQRKKLRKTMEDIKKSSQKPHLDTDSDEDYRDFDSFNDLEDGNEFLGFDENSVGSAKHQKNNEPLANAENKSQISTSTTKATKGGTLKNWLTTGKAIAPTLNKDPPVNRRHDDIITQGIPLKKRWDKAANLNEETDITDDTSPADDEDERDSVRGLKTVINSNTDKLGSKKIKLNKTKNTNHTFLEPRPVATKSNAATDSECQQSELCTQRSSKRNIYVKKDLETHKSLDIPAKQILKTQDNSEAIHDLTSEDDTAQDENSKTAINCEDSLLKELMSKDLSKYSNKQNKVKLNDRKVSFEDIPKTPTPTLTDFSTEDESNKTHDSPTKRRSSNTRTNKRQNSRVSLEKSPAAQSDFSTEDESNRTQDFLNKCKNLKEISNKPDNGNRVSKEDTDNDESSSSRNKKNTSKAKMTFEDALNISSQFDKPQIKKATISKNSPKEIATIDIKPKEIQTPETPPPKSKKTTSVKETDKLHKVHQDTSSAKTATNSEEFHKSNTSKKKKLVPAAAEKNSLDTNLSALPLRSPSSSNKKPLKIEVSEEECSPQIPKKRGRKRKFPKLEDTSEDDSTALNQNSTNSRSLNSLKPISTPHLPVIKHDSSMEISTPSKKRKSSNIDTNAVGFNPRLLLITKREQIDTDEVLTEPNPGTGPLQCGLCLKRTTSSKWTLHLSEHYGVGWQVGQPNLNVENRSTVFNTISCYFKATAIKGLSCRMCKKLFRSALGLMIHLESCGTPALRLVCEYCKKNYTKLTMPIHLRSCPERTRLEKSLSDKAITAMEEPQEEVFTNTGRLKRHSTIKAESKLKVIGAELQQSPEQTVEFEPKDHLKFVPPLDKKEVHRKWSEDLEKFAKGFCPKKICKFNSPHLEELEEHITECKFIKTGYFCNFCRKMCFETEEVALEHILKTHKPGSEVSDDSDSDVKIEAEQSSDDDNDLSEGVNEDETENEATADEDVDNEKKNSQTRRVKKKVISNNNRSQKPEAISSANRKRVYDTRALDVNKEVIGKWKNFLSENYSTEALFPHLTSHYSINKNQDFAKYLPSQGSSMKFCLEKQNRLHTTVGQPNPNIEWNELKRFETIENTSEIFYFLGAPVKFCSWIPLPADVEEQYILVGYRKEMFNFVKFSQPKPHHTILIIFKVTHDKKVPKLELHYGFVVNDGPVHGVQFLPSGGYDVNTNRLGLVAVATINSAIKVYSLPLEVVAEECDKIENLALIDVRVSFELNVDVMDQGQTDHVVMKPQCLQICWSEFSGHNHIFASYSNGFVGIWDITDDPQENLNRFVVENVICYASLNYFYIGEKGSNCMAVHYDTNGPRWLAVSAKYRKFVIYDIHNFMQPFIIKEECNKNILRCLNWSPVWGPLLAGYCDSIPNNGRCISSISPNNILFTQQRFENMVSAVSYIDYSPVTNLLVSTADNGDILFADPQELHYDYGLGKKFGVPRRVLSAMDVKQLDNEAIVRPPLKQSKTDIKLPSDWTVHESDYKDKYGLVFNAPLKLKEETKSKYYNNSRRAPLNITPLMRINSLKCNLNYGAKRLVAAGYENGFMRIMYFNKDVQFNWK